MNSILIKNIHDCTKVQAFSNESDTTTPSVLYQTLFGTKR